MIKLFWNTDNQTKSNNKIFSKSVKFLGEKKYLNDIFTKIADKGLFS